MNAQFFIPMLHVPRIYREIVFVYLRVDLNLGSFTEDVHKVFRLSLSNDIYGLSTQPSFFSHLEPNPKV